MSDLVVLNICIQTQKQLNTLNNFWVLLKSVLIDLRARNFMHAKTSLHASCMHACHRAHNLLSPVKAPMYEHVLFGSPTTHCIYPIVVTVHGGVRGTYLFNEENNCESIFLRLCNFHHKPSTKTLLQNLSCKIFLCRFFSKLSGNQKNQLPRKKKWLLFISWYERYVQLSKFTCKWQGN